MSGVALEERSIAEVDVGSGFDTDVDPNGTVLPHPIDAGALRGMLYIPILVLILNTENV